MWRRVIGVVLAVLAGIAAVALAILGVRRILQATLGRVMRVKTWQPTSDPTVIAVREPGGELREVRLPEGVTSDQVVAAGTGEASEVAVEILHDPTNRHDADTAADVGNDLPI